MYLFIADPFNVTEKGLLARNMCCVIYCHLLNVRVSKVFKVIVMFWVTSNNFTDDRQGTKNIVTTEMVPVILSSLCGDEIINSDLDRQFLTTSIQSPAVISCCHCWKLMSRRMMLPKVVSLLLKHLS